MPARTRRGPTVGPLQPDQYRPEPKGGSKPKPELSNDDWPGWQDTWDKDKQHRPDIRKLWEGDPKKEAARRKAEAKKKKAAQGKALKDLGEVKSLDVGFCKTAGAVLEALVPKVGDKGKIQLNVNTPLGGTPAKLTLKLVGSAERDAKGVKFRPEIAAGVMGQAKVGIGRFALEVFAKAGLTGYLEAYGDSGAEVFRLLMMAFSRGIRNVSSTFADLIFTKKDAGKAWDQMDEDDYVEWAVGTSWALGASVKAGDKGGGASHGRQNLKGARLDKHKGRRRKTNLEKKINTTKLAVDPWGVEVKFVDLYERGKLKSTEIETCGEAMVDIKDLNKNIIVGQGLSQYVATVGKMVQRNAGLHSEGARFAGGMARTSSQLVSGGLGVDVGAQKALERLKGFSGVKVGWKLTWKGKRDLAAKKGSIEISLEKASNIEFGDNDRDTVYVLLENLQEVFKLEGEV